MWFSHFRKTSSIWSQAEWNLGRESVHMTQSSTVCQLWSVSIIRLLGVDMVQHSQWLTPHRPCQPGFPCPSICGCFLKNIFILWRPQCQISKPNYFILPTNIWIIKYSRPQSKLFTCEKPKGWWDTGGELVHHQKQKATISSLKYLSNTRDGETLSSKGTRFKPSGERSTISPGCRTLGRRLQLDRQEQDLRVRPGQQTIRIKQDVIKCLIKIPKNSLEGKNTGDQCQGSMLFLPLLFGRTPPD